LRTASELILLLTGYPDVDMKGSFRRAKDTIIGVRRRSESTHNINVELEAGFSVTSLYG